MVEVDLRETGDGHLVLLHDDTLDRTTNRTGCLAHLSLEQVQRLNAGHWQRIPTLEEALIVAGGALGMMLELKVEGIGLEARAVVGRSRFAGTVIYASFLFEELKRIRAADPTAAVMPLLEETLPRDPLREAVELKASHVGLDYRTLTPALVKTLHNVGFLVFAYTVNEPQDIQQVRALEVDGVISDFPDRI
jgi:glycerophosphoryl diester phosphodiesterase